MDNYWIGFLTALVFVTPFGIQIGIMLENRKMNKYLKELLDKHEYK